MYICEHTLYLCCLGMCNDNQKARLIMKTELTYKQTVELIDLGVPIEKASGKGYFESVVGCYHTFKLEDLLNEEILPKEIEIPVFYDDLEEPEYYIKYRIAFEWDSSNFTQIEPQYNAFYKEIAFVHGGYLAKFSSEELIDSLYQLACWYYGEFLKNKIKIVEERYTDDEN